MTGRARQADRLRLAALLAPLSPIDAARAVARPDRELEALLPSEPFLRARSVVDAFEQRAAARADRKQRGVFYTPAKVVGQLLERVPLRGRILDPACGAGAFVLALAQRVGLEGLDRIHAADVDPEALEACALALGSLFGAAESARIEAWRRSNTHRRDFLREPAPGAAPDLVIGNPPYGLSDDDDLRGLFPALRGEIDLFACFLLRAIDVVSPHGTSALVVPDTWLTNEGARFMREQLLERTGVARIVDFGKPFRSARDTRVHAVVLRRGAEGATIESDRDGVLVPMAARARGSLEADARRGWFLYRTDEEVRAIERLESRSVRLKDCFDVVYGLRTGRNAAHLAPGPGDVPIVGGVDLGAFDRHPRGVHLIDPSAFPFAMQRQRERWKIGIQRIRTNSRVPWRRWLEAALVRPDELGLDSLTLAADRSRTDAPGEALLALLGVLNSAVLNRWYKLTYTDVNVKPMYVGELPVPPPSAPLARLVRQRLDRPGEALALERAIDRLVASAYGLDERALDVLEQGYWGDERAKRPLPSLEAALRLAGA